MAEMPPKKLQNAPKSFKMPKKLQNAQKSFKMPQKASKCPPPKVSK
jgi:hypothetical protein